MCLHRRTVLLRASAVLVLITVFGHPGDTPTLTAERRGSSDIVGGREAARGAWPWQAAVLRSDEGSMFRAQYCGGALIDPGWVLTSAHCVISDPSRLYQGAMYAHEIHVGLGIHDLKADESRAQRIAVAEVVVHPDFFENDASELGDLALLRLAQPARLDQAVQPVPLVDSAGDPAIQPGARATLTGWGLIDGSILPAALHEVEVPIQDSPWCELFGKHVLCAGDPVHDACAGDDGGPLVVRSADGDSWRLAGVTGEVYAEDCGDQVPPTFYANVAHYRAWITGVLARPAPGLEIEMMAPEVVAPRSTFQYRLEVRNTGRAPARQVKVYDVAPMGQLDLVSVSPGGRIVVDPRDSSRHAEWALPELAIGATVDLTSTVRHVPLSQAAAQLHGDPRSVSRTGDIRGSRTRAQGSPGSRARTEGTWGLPARQPEAPLAGMWRTAPFAPAAPDIIGGRAAAPGAWPWQVAIEMSNILSSGSCGGSLIAPDWVLTAAHCVLGAQWSQVRVGSNQRSGNEGQKIAVATAFPNLRIIVNREVDIALLKLEHAATLSATVKPISLADASNTHVFAAGELATVTGWGITSWTERLAAEDLQEVSLPIVEASRCAHFADPRYTLCAGPPEGGRSTCYGDSGGPLVVPRPDGTYVQVGVVSRGTQVDCGAPGSLSLFSMPLAVRDWIDDTMATGHQDTWIEHEAYAAEAQGGIEADGHSAYIVVSHVVPGDPPPIMPPTASTPLVTRTPTAAPTRLTPAPGGLIYLPSLNNGP